MNRVRAFTRTMGAAPIVGFVLVAVLATALFVHHEMPMDEHGSLTAVCIGLIVATGVLVASKPAGLRRRPRRSIALYPPNGFHFTFAEFDTSARAGPMRAGAVVLLN